VNPWLWAEIVLWTGLLACAVISLRGKLAESIVAMEMASLIGAIAIAMLSQGFGEPSWIDLALALALLSFPGGLLFLIFVERWR
jgi:multisubunit Na+/H+ antiporter MnhF subunit